ncbi:ATP-dependent zinc protease [Roseibacillus ishigakijimensis]|uniref:ATP-dependent zinc protease n=1 Tax=Roseibacillus ishigakijimensis TaxID=454146 RepID=A0A934RNG4_9BACT|nr:RimK/LysX family protein [Roseibacillus ishigakijimensis]MBK1834025.1 ATP-dependent zinc protease [Roseibacillus ishigakijimensis]
MKDYRVARISQQAEPVWGKDRSAGEKLVIGRREWIALPQLGVPVLHGKIDTGAYRSSLHAEQIERFQRDGEEWVRFVTHSQDGRAISCESVVAFCKRVKSSTGEARERCFLRTKFRTPGGLEWVVRISLADRSEMTFPLLIGRRALSRRFVVDTAQSHLLGSQSDLTGKHWRRKKS